MSPPFVPTYSHLSHQIHFYDSKFLKDIQTEQITEKMTEMSHFGIGTVTTPLEGNPVTRLRREGSWRNRMEERQYMIHKR